LCLKLDATVAVYEDQCIHETPGSDTAEGFTCISAHTQTVNQCVLEDDLDDIAAFPVFCKQSSRRLRRTSIEIYRKSLHDADEEVCDTNEFTVNRESDSAAADVDMHSVSNGAFCNELPVPVSKSDDSQTDSIYSSSAVQPKTGIVFVCYIVAMFCESVLFC